MSVQARVKNIENKLSLLGLEERIFIAFSKGHDTQLLNKDGSRFVKPESFNKSTDTLVVLAWSLRQPD